MMAVDADYFGMTLVIPDSDRENLAFFDYCRQHRFHLQKCSACGLVRYPPTTACPFCGHPESVWAPVEASGTVYSYTRISHATNPAFRPFVPYMVVIVELDMQRDIPKGHAIRIPGIVAAPDGSIAKLEGFAGIGINSRMRMIFHDVCDGMALPLWVSEDSDQTDIAWILQS